MEKAIEVVEAYLKKWELTVAYTKDEEKMPGEEIYCEGFTDALKGILVELKIVALAEYVKNFS